MSLFEKFMAQFNALDKAEKLKLEKAMLPEMGGEIEAEAFEVGQAAFVVTEDGEKVALPEGSYEIEGLEGITSIAVDANGIITEVGAAASETVEEGEANEDDTEVEVEAENQEEANAESSAEAVETQPSLADQIDQIKEALLTEIMAACDEKYEAKKELMRSQKARAKRPVSPNPEGKAPEGGENKQTNFSRPKSNFDRAMEQINK